MAAADIEIPKTYKAAVYDKPGTISTKIEELETPEPGPGQVLVRLTHSGVCHSDLGVMKSNWAALPLPTQAGQVGGHEGVGIVVKQGPGVTTPALNTRVGIKWISATCSTCPPCLTGHDGLCFNQKVSGYYTPGTFAQYCLGPADYVTPIPSGLDSALAAPMLCAGVTTYSALRKCGAKAGEWVVLLGAGGGLGHIAVQLAAAGKGGMGFRVIGVDSGSKKELVMQCGAEEFIDFAEGNTEERVKQITGGLGAHAVLVLSGNNKAYEMAMPLLRFGGRLVCVGIPEGEPVDIRGAVPQWLIAREQSIVGVAVGDRQEAVECLEFAARGVVKTRVEVVRMEELTGVFERMERGELMGRVVLDLS